MLNQRRTRAAAMRLYARVRVRLHPFGRTSVGAKYLVQASTKCTHDRLTCGQRKVTYRHFYHPCPLALLSTEAEDGYVPETDADALLKLGTRSRGWWVAEK